MFKLIAIALFICSVTIYNCDAAPLAEFQYLEPKEGYVPVYIRVGDTPLSEINPQLAAAFKEGLSKPMKLIDSHSDESSESHEHGSKISSEELQNLKKPESSEESHENSHSDESSEEMLKRPRRFQKRRSNIVNISRRSVYRNLDNDSKHSSDVYQKKSKRQQDKKLKRRRRSVQETKVPSSEAKAYKAKQQVQPVKHNAKAQKVIKK